MKIEIDISADKITQLFGSAMEGGDPVTTARKGGWCAGIYYRSNAKGSYWYAEPKNFTGRFSISIYEVIDESKWEPEETDVHNIKIGAVKVHKIDQSHVAAGLAKMATVFPHQFADLLKGDQDAPCADAFLQAMLFGEEKYA